MLSAGAHSVASVDALVDVHVTGGSLKLSERSAFESLLELTGGTIELDGSNGFLGDHRLDAFNMTGGTLSGSGRVILPGTSTWSGGTVSGAGTLVVASGASLACSGTVTLDRPLENHGQTTIGSGGFFYLNAGADLSNLNHLTVTAPKTIGAYGGSLENQGTMSVGGSGEILRSGQPGSQYDFLNLGTLRIVSGTLELGGVGHTNSGLIEVESAGTLWMHQGLVHTATATVVGTGTLRNSAGVADFAGGIQFDGVAEITNELRLAGDSTIRELELGPFGSIGGGGDVTVTEVFDGDNGSVLTGGRLILDSGAVATSVNGFSITGYLENRGQLFVDSGSLAGSGGIVNAAGALLEVRNGADGPVGGGSSSFVNAGTYRATGPGMTEIAMVSVENNGSIEVTGGSVTLGHAWGAANSVFVNNGSLTAAAGSQVRLDETTCAVGGTIGGAGDYEFFGDHPSPIDGTFDPSGTVELTGGTTIFAPGSFLPTGDVVVTAGQHTIANVFAPASFTGIERATLELLVPMTFSDLTIGLGTNAGYIDGNSDVTVTGTVQWTAGGPRGTGKFILAAGSLCTTSGSPTIERQLDNHGTLLAQGTLVPNSVTVHNHATGVIELQAGCDVSSYFSPTTLINDGVLRSTGGGLSKAYFSQVTNNGTIQALAGELEFFNDWGAFSFANTGTVDAQAGTIRIKDSWTNAGTLAAAAGAVLRVEGALTLDPSSQVDVGIVSTSSYGVLQTTAALQLAGTLGLVVDGGYVPVSGDTFDVVTFPSATGTFDTITGNDLGGGQTLTESYLADRVRLQVTP